jgi:energy-coupling factor transporter ATP-binding protein EcfA2
MYIKELKLTNIRSVKELKMTFKHPAGWHVILGDNGSGKSSIIRAICAGLVGPSEVLRLDPDFSTWVTKGAQSAEISLRIEKSEVDLVTGKGKTTTNTTFDCNTVISQDKTNGRTWKFFLVDSAQKFDLNRYNWSDARSNGWFSAAFGPYRRFVGGDQSLDSFYTRNPKIGAHLTAFKESAALTESVVWLKQVLLNSLSKKTHSDGIILNGVRTFINQGKLLPEGFELLDISAEGLIFSTPTSTYVHLFELSEGLKSVICLALELIRLLVDTYGAESVFSKMQVGSEGIIDSEGVVLIDEIDVHLHPSWQARIGQWFTTCFPNIQFIVTTHSPIICRAGVKGSVWRLTREDDGSLFQQIVERELEDLLYGDILDAYDTGLFGTNVTRSKEGQLDLELVAQLNMKFLKKETTNAEDKTRLKLNKRYRINGTN